MKLEPFYFFADLISYVDGDKTRRTIVAKIKAESQPMAQHNLLQLYKYIYQSKDVESFNIIPATLDDWDEYQLMLVRKKLESRYKNQQPGTKRGSRYTKRIAEIE